MTDQNRKNPSLRDLARRLGCSHSSLSEQVHRGDLTRGVSIVDGRAVVTDIDVAAAAWNGQPAAWAAKAIVLKDYAMDCRVTALDLFKQRDALSLLACALTSDALTGCDAGALQKRIAKRLREVAELHGADKQGIRHAKDELQSAIELLALADEDDDEEETDDEEENKQETP